MEGSSLSDSMQAFASGFFEKVKSYHHFQGPDESRSMSLADWTGTWEVEGDWPEEVLEILGMQATPQTTEERDAAAAPCETHQYSVSSDGFIVKYDTLHHVPGLFSDNLVHSSRCFCANFDSSDQESPYTGWVWKNSWDEEPIGFTSDLSKTGDSFLDMESPTVSIMRHLTSKDKIVISVKIFEQNKRDPKVFRKVVMRKVSPEGPPLPEPDAEDAVPAAEPEPDAEDVPAEEPEGNDAEAEATGREREGRSSSAFSDVSGAMHTIAEDVAMSCGDFATPGRSHHRMSTASTSADSSYFSASSSTSEGHHRHRRLSEVMHATASTGGEPLLLTREARAILQINGWDWPLSRQEKRAVASIMKEKEVVAGKDEVLNAFYSRVEDICEERQELFTAEKDEITANLDAVIAEKEELTAMQNVLTARLDAEASARQIAEEAAQGILAFAAAEKASAEAEAAKALAKAEAEAQKAAKALAELAELKLRIGQS